MTRRFPLAEPARAAGAGASGILRAPVPSGDSAAAGRHTGRVSIADELLEQRRLRRRAGDPRVTAEDRELILRLTTGDLVEDFQRSLYEIAAADPLGRPGGVELGKR